MGKKCPTNETFHIGDIFQTIFRDECGSSCEFYQVVGLRAKTLVELRLIRTEDFVDETCILGLGYVKVRPLPGQFFEDCPAFTARVCGPSDIDGRRVLCYHDKSCDLRYVYSEVRDGEIGHLSGYDGIYVLNKMKKERKL